MTRILVADDNQKLCEILNNVLSERGYNVEIANDGKTAVEKAHQEYFDIVLTDLRMPKLDGIEVLKNIKEISPTTTVIIVTAYGTVENAVEAMRIGAFDYVLKPFSAEEIDIKIKRAIETQRLTQNNEVLRETVQNTFGTIVGNSEKMKNVYELIERVAPTNAPVLIQGATGTGKELVARENS